MQPSFNLKKKTFLTRFSSFHKLFPRFSLLPAQADFRFSLYSKVASHGRPLLSEDITDWKECRYPKFRYSFRFFFAIRYFVPNTISNLRNEYRLSLFNQQYSTLKLKKNIFKK